MNQKLILTLALTCMISFLPPLIAKNCCPKTCYTSCCKPGCCPMPCTDNCSCDASSKTFFYVRPLYQSVRPELITGFRNERDRAREDGKGGALDFVLFGSNSTKDRRLASYFMPYCKTTLVVSEKTPTPGFTPDLYAPNFNIHTLDSNYTGTICIAMNQSAVGLGIHYKQRFAWTDDDMRGGWFSFSSPITHIRNKVTMYENSNSTDLTVNPDTPTAVTSMCAAFNQPAWNYGRIAANAKMGKTGLADIEAKLGYEWLICEKTHVAGYVGALIPTGNKPCGRYVFEPIIGHGGYAGLMWGADGGYQLWADDEKERNISFEWAAHGQYLFGNTQKRSFDLVNRPWSRYLDVYANKEQAQTALGTGSQFLATPGINVFTRDVKVTPGFNGNATAAFVLSAGGFQGEMGYNVYARQSECVKLSCPWPTGDNAPALKDIDGVGNLNPFRTIDGNFYLETLPAVQPINPFTVTNYALYSIKETDLNLRSAAHPAFLAHMVHAALGYRWDEIKYPVHIDGGASYEFTLKKNTTLNRWVAWFKGGFSF